MDHHPSLLGKLCVKDTKLREGGQIPAGVKSFLPRQREGIWLALRLKGHRRRVTRNKDLSKGRLATYPTALCITNMMNTPISLGVVLKLHIWLAIAKPA